MKRWVVGVALAMALAPTFAGAQDSTGATGAGIAAGDGAASQSSSMPIWPWVGGGLVAAAVGAAVAASSDGNGGGGTTTTTSTN